MSQPKMGKKMKLPSLFKNRGDLKNNHHPWQWASSACSHPRTLSFQSGGETMFKTMNSVFFDHAPEFECQEGWSVSSSESSQRFSAALEGSLKEEEESVEVIIRGAQSERLFFEPRDSCMIVESKDQKGCSERWASWSPALGRSMMLAMESEDPYGDFRRSMEEMVESHGLRDWECLKELLGWYLKVNGESNHGFIVGAFVDLLVAAASSSSFSSSSSSTAFSSSSSCCTYSSASVAFNSAVSSSSTSSSSSAYHDPTFSSSSFCSVSTSFDSAGSSFSSVSASRSLKGLAERRGKMVLP